MIETSGHLPECPCIAVGVPSCICDNDEECGPQCRHHCICPALRACEARLYTLMGAAIQSGIEAEQERIRLAIAALVDNDVIDLSLPEYRAVVNAINEEEA